MRTALTEEFQLGLWKMVTSLMVAHPTPPRSWAQRKPQAKAHSDRLPRKRRAITRHVLFLAP